MGKQIQRAGSAILSVRPVFYPYEVVLDGAHKLLLKGTVYIPKCVERKRGRVVSVTYVRYFRSGGAFRDDGHRSRIGRGHDPCFQERCADSGGEGDAKVSERAKYEVCVDGCRV